MCALGSSWLAMKSRRAQRHASSLERLLAIIELYPLDFEELINEMRGGHVSLGALEHLELRRELKQRRIVSL